MGDEATLSFNFYDQTFELKATNRYVNDDDLRVFDFKIYSLGQGIGDGRSVIDEVNLTLASWGWRPTQVSDWHGVRDWAAALTPAD